VKYGEYIDSRGIVMETGGSFYPAYGVWFSKGSLRIGNHNSMTVCRPWGEKAGAWRKTRAHPDWKSVRPDNVEFDEELARYKYFPTSEYFKNLDGERGETGQLLLPFNAVERSEAYRKFFALIPPEALKTVRRFRRRQWHILQFLNRVGKPAFDLADCPILQFLIANNWVFGPRTTKVQRTARRLCWIKRRRAAAWLGFPEKESTIEVFRKCAPGSLGVTFCFYLRTGILNAAVNKLLTHAPRINTGMIRLVADDLSPCVTPNLLFEIGLEKREDRKAYTAYMLKDILRMSRYLFEENPFRVKFKCRQEIQDIHDEFIRALNTGSNFHSDILNMEFPPPPDLWYPDGEFLTVKPMRTPIELIDLGREQSNCVASLARLVANKECYIFRIQSHETATLALRKEMGQYQIIDLKGASNQPVDDITRHFVDQWLRLAQNQQYDPDVMNEFYNDNIPF